MTDETILIVILAIVWLATLAVLMRTLDHQQDEREAWAKERQKLVDRAIARHTGEVLALDREPKPRAERDEASPVFIEGIS